MGYNLMPFQTQDYWLRLFRLQFSYYSIITIARKLLVASIDTVRSIHMVCYTYDKLVARHYHDFLHWTLQLTYIQYVIKMIIVI